MAVHLRSHQKIFVGGWWLSHHVNISSFDVWFSYHYWWDTNILIDVILYRFPSVVQLPLKPSKEQRRQGFLRVAAHPLQPVELQSVSVSWCFFQCQFFCLPVMGPWIISMCETSKNDHPEWWVISACKKPIVNISVEGMIPGEGRPTEDSNQPDPTGKMQRPLDVINHGWEINEQGMEAFMNFPPATTMG